MTVRKNAGTEAGWRGHARVSTGEDGQEDGCKAGRKVRKASCMLRGPGKVGSQRDRNGGGGIEEESQ